MPHCVIECPVGLQELVSFSDLVKVVHDAAESIGIFEHGDVKARVVTTENYLVGGGKEHFVHVVAHILEGREMKQKSKLADSISISLCNFLPMVKMISVEVRDIQKAAYSNRISIKKITSNDS